MVWFFQLRGRQMGGVFIIMAPPSEGKSYVATAIVLELLKQGVKVFTNFPVQSVDGKYVSYVFTKELMKQNLNGCAVFIDEGYTMFNSRKYMEFADEDHDWFATSGHNEMMIFIIVQNANRVDKVIREVLNLVYVVHKVKLPIFDLPLWFTMDSLLDIEDLRDYRKGLIDPYSRERFRFTVDVALAYDTRYFRKSVLPPYGGKTWIEEYEENGYTFEPIKLNLVQWVKYRCGDRVCNTLDASWTVVESVMDGKIWIMLKNLETALIGRLNGMKSNIPSTMNRLKSKTLIKIQKVQEYVTLNVTRVKQWMKKHLKLGDKP